MKKGMLNLSLIIFNTDYILKWYLEYIELNKVLQWVSLISFYFILMRLLEI